MDYPQVVRVFATTQDPDYDCPWQARTPSRSTGSGVVIGPDQILTGAHVVANGTFLQIQKLSDPNKTVAHVVSVCHDADLALLEVEAEGFLSDIEPAPLGELPDLRQKVSVVGYPVGGEEISITEGVVSRLEVQRYSHSQRHLLAVTVDAAINAGNSGGPVFSGNEVVGIAFQKLSGADNIGEMVPPPVIRTFLDGIEAGKEPRIPGMGISTQNLENPQLRRKLGLTEDESGVMIVGIEYGSAAQGCLNKRDVLLEVDGLRIANNGTVQYRDRYRTRYDVLLGQNYIGNTMKLRVLRGGERIDVDMTLRQLRYLVPRAQYDVQPTYFVYGGLVFQALTRDFLATWESWWNKAPKEFLNYYYSGTRTEERQQVVVLTQILADELNVGYGHLYNEGIKELNGVKVRDMVDFVERIEATEGVVEINTSSGGVIMLDAAETKAAQLRIMQRYHIARDRSANLPGTVQTNV
jgi:S1-C subfamily serine protease